MNVTKKTSIVWFRNDLRLTDHAALHHALESSDFVIPVFIWSPDENAAWEPGAASKWWLHQSLQSLQADLLKYQSRLILRAGDYLKVLTAIAKEANAEEFFWNRRYEPLSLKNDQQIEEKLKQSGYGVKTFSGALLFEPWKIKNQQGGPYKVYTPFWNFFTSLDSPLKPFAKPISLKTPDRCPKSLKIEDFNLEPKIDWVKGLQENWEPGQAGAKKELSRFIKDSLYDYEIERNRPDHRGTSRLSPHLHFGEISPQTIWHSIPKKHKVIPYLRQIVWREFASHLLYHFPETPDQPLNQKFLKFPWKKNKLALRAWERGKTGYPIVDAGMRELWNTGWMHNRVRMIAASFLVKDLMIPWQEGAKWFWDTLVDADLANNTMGWQWVAGCGADAAPFFRIFNPVTQGEKFDPDGDYVRKWIPEISKIPNKWIHKPWLATADALQTAGIVLGKDYPKPIVDHNHARRVALLSYEGIRR